MTERRYPGRLSTQLVLYALLALAAAAAVFFVGSSALNEQVMAHTASAEYQDHLTEQALDGVQRYIDHHALRLEQVFSLSAWEEQHPYTLMTILSKNRLLYSTGMQPGDIWAYAEEEYETPEDGRMTLRFSDGTASVFFHHFTDPRYEALVYAGTGIAAFLLFAVLMMAAIRKKLRYITRLTEELKVLEGGDLSPPFTMEGRDELRDLARGMEEMRLSLNRRQQESDEARQANAELVTAVSHDLRTPLTSLIGYMDLLAEGRAATPQQQTHFITTAREKARQIKELSDKLFDYFFVYSRQEDADMTRENADILLGQMLDALVMDLRSQGLQTELCLDELGGDILANPTLLLRAFDNLKSNAQKYADQKEPVWVSCVQDGKQAVIRMENGLPEHRERRESTNMGLKTCQRVFNCHGGSFETNETDGTFRVEIRLPLI